MSLLQIAVLRERAIAKVGPETMQGPAVLGKKLALGLETSISIPELGAQNQTAEGLDAARVSEIGLSLRRAGEQRCRWN